jgi:thymidine kinase
MFSGKTTYLINKYNQCLENNKTVCVINFADDKRYNDTMLSSHDKVMIPCIFTRTIHELLETDEIRNADSILINEGQFFDDLYEVVVHMVEKLNKSVHVCGLDGDFKRKKFGTILDLIPLCDKITKLNAKCDKCFGKAIFSHRITNESQQVVIGTNNYVPLCRKCYINYNNLEVTSEYHTTLAL